VSTTPIGYELLNLGPNLWLGLGQVGKEELLKLFLAAAQGWLSSLKRIEALVIDTWRYLTSTVVVLVEID